MAAAVTAILSAWAGQSAFAGSVLGWGSQVVGVDLSGGFTAIAGGEHSLGLKQDGSIVAWGWNEHGQCDVPLPNSDFIALSAGAYHSLGLKQDGSIVAWGLNVCGQCDVPSPNTGFIAIAAGGEHSLGLKQDGSIVAWGDNYYGQCDVPSPNSDFLAIAAGNVHSLGLKQDGSIVAWGDNRRGQCNVPSPNSGFIAIAGGYYHSLGIRECPYALAGDLNDDCRVDFVDVGWMAADWLQSGSFADIYPPPEGDDIVNFRDFAVVAANWLIDCDLTPGNPACVPK